MVQAGKCAVSMDTNVEHAKSAKSTVVEGFYVMVKSWKVPFWLMLVEHLPSKVIYAN